MSTKSAETPPKPHPEEAQFAAQKAAFEEAKRKTAIQAGAPDPKAPKETKTPATVEPKAEEPAPAPEKPKAKPKPVEAPTAALEAQIAALTAKIEALSAPKAKEPEPEDDDPLEDIRSELSERFGEEEGAALVKALEALHAPAAKRLAQLEKILSDAQASGRTTISKSNRARLSEKHPQIKNDTAWEMIHERVVAGFEKDAKRWESAEAAYDEVVSALYGAPEAPAEEPEEEEVDEDVELAASRVAAAAMTAPAKTGRQTRSRMDKQREHFEFIKKNPSDKAGHARLARELGIDR